MWEKKLIYKHFSKEGLINFKYFFKNDYFFLLTHAQLAKSYVNLGLHASYVNNNLSRYISGHYYSISIIDVYKLLYSLKSNLLLILRIALKNYLSLLVIHEDYKFSKLFAITYNNLGIDYFFGFWWAGLLKNFKSITYHKPFAHKMYNFKYNRFPGFAIYIHPAELKHPDAVQAIAKEFNNVHLLNLCIFDTNSDGKLVDNWILSNTISFKSSIFWLKIFELVAIKILLLRKKKFFYKVFNNLLNEKTL